MHAVVELSWEVRVQTFLRTKPYGHSMHNEVGTCEEMVPSFSMHNEVGTCAEIIPWVLPNNGLQRFVQPRRVWFLSTLVRGRVYKSESLSLEWVNHFPRNCSLD